MPEVDEYSPITPLESVVGVSDAEAIYDMLGIRDQLILDLLTAGWNQTEIGEVLSRSQWTINREVRRIRFKLANTKLRLILESRINNRNTNSQLLRAKSSEDAQNEDFYGDDYGS